jgi:hypothetical protein
VLLFTNGCAALAVGADKAYGWGHAYGRGEAEAIALDKCAQYGAGCRIRVWACNE